MLQKCLLFPAHQAEKCTPHRHALLFMAYGKGERTARQTGAKGGDERRRIQNDCSAKKIRYRLQDHRPRVQKPRRAALSYTRSAPGKCAGASYVPCETQIIGLSPMSSNARKTSATRVRTSSERFLVVALMRGAGCNTSSGLSYRPSYDHPIASDAGMMIQGA